MSWNKNKNVHRYAVREKTSKTFGERERELGKKKELETNMKQEDRENWVKRRWFKAKEKEP